MNRLCMFEHVFSNTRLFMVVLYFNSMTTFTTYFWRANVHLRCLLEQLCIITQTDESAYHHPSSDSRSINMQMMVAALRGMRKISHTVMQLDAAMVHAGCNLCNLHAKFLGQKGIVLSTMKVGSCHLMNMIGWFLIDKRGDEETRQSVSPHAIVEDRSILRCVKRVSARQPA